MEDIYWFVPANSPIKSVNDITDKHTIAYSTNGSTSDSVLRALIAHYGLKAKPTQTGGPPGTFTMTMSGQIDIGWSVAPFGLKDLQAKTIRVLMRGSDVPSMRRQTVRVEIVNARALTDRHDVMVRFMRAYRETLDWMYSNPLAVKYYSEQMQMPESLVELQRNEFNPKSAMNRINCRISSLSCRTRSPANSWKSRSLRNNSRSSFRFRRVRRPPSPI